MMHAEELATALAEAIARRIGPQRYQLWFDRHTRFRFADGVLTVGVPNRHFEEWLLRTFRDSVAAAAAEVFGAAVSVQFVIDPELFQAARREQAEVRASVPAIPVNPPDGPAVPVVGKQTGAAPGVGKVRPTTSAATAAAPGSNQRDDVPRSPAGAAREARTALHSLGDFVVGPSNRVAHAAALAVAEEPGEGPNPLVLHGPVGTGKTHLLEGIYGALRRQRPDWRVTYVTTEDFTNRFVQAMRLGKLAAFRKQFRECDALLVDDLHFLATRRATQEEFLHTFDALYADGRQMVLACDCHPRLADDFTPELTDRLLGGAVWGLTPPDAETRLAILRARATGPGAPVADATLSFLAGQLRGNVRELEGALNSVRHFARVTGQPADIALAREALADLLRHAIRVVQLQDVDRAVCAVLKLGTGTLQKKARGWAVSHPRMLAMYLCRKHTTASYSEIGGHFGGRNHSTTVAAEKKARQWIEENAEIALGERQLRVRDLVERVERELFR